MREGGGTEEGSQSLPPPTTTKHRRVNRGRCDRGTDVDRMETCCASRRAACEKGRKGELRGRLLPPPPPKARCLGSGKNSENQNSLGTLCGLVDSSHCKFQRGVDLAKGVPDIPSFWGGLGESGREGGRNGGFVSCRSPVRRGPVRFRSQLRQRRRSSHLYGGEREGESESKRENRESARRGVGRFGGR